MPRSSKPRLKEVLVQAAPNPPRKHNPARLASISNRVNFALTYGLATTQQEARMMEALTQTPFRDNPPVPPPPTGGLEPVVALPKKTAKRRRSKP